MTNRNGSGRSQRPAVLIVLLGLLIAAVGLFLKFHPSQQQITTVRASGPPPRPLSSSERLVPGEDRAENDFSAKFVRPVSAWRDRAKRRYRDLLAAGQFDTLVVPVQVMGSGFDRATRSYFTARLASALAAGGAGRIPDPDLVERALGERQRRFESNDIYWLAKKLAVKRVILVYAGHSGRRYPNKPKLLMSIRTRRQDAGADGRLSMHTPFERFAIERVPLDDDFSALEVFEQNIEEIVTALGFDYDPPKQRTVDRLDGKLPATPMPDDASNANPAQTALSLQLLAALVPEGDDMLRRQLYQRSLAMLDGLSSDSPDYAALKARAYLYLGYRPLALALLAQPSNPTERGLVAALNGNLNELERETASITSESDRLLALITLSSVRAAYGLADRKQSKLLAESLALPKGGWAELVYRKLTEHEDWEQYRNVTVKTLLDAAFPVDGHTAENIVAESVASGRSESERTIFAKSHIAHAERFIETARDAWCCSESWIGARAIDYFDVLQSVGHANLVRRASLMVTTQARPDAARSFVNDLFPTYDGHPALESIRAQVELALARRAQAGERESLVRSATSRLNAVVYWSQELSNDAESALHGRHWVLASGEHRATIGTPFSLDLPTRYASRQSCNRPSGRVRFNAALSAATWQIDLAKAELDCQKNSAAYQSARTDVLKGRFVGHPDLTLQTVDAHLHAGERDEAVEQLQAFVKARPGFWRARSRLYNTLMTDGLYDEAVDVVMAYPPMTDPSDRQVEVSNIAYEVGSKLFWRGMLSESQPFFELAANLNTGSGGSLGSIARLALLGGDLVTAGQLYLARAQRYNSPFAYREYLNVLHAFGYSEQAWTLFDALVSQRYESTFWESTLVGHRMQRSTDAQIIAWGKERIKDPKETRSRWAAEVLLSDAVVDRAPSPDRVAALDELAIGGWVMDGPLPGADETPGPLEPRSEAGPKHPNAVRTRPLQAQFAEAYAQLIAEDFEGAAKTFRRAAADYNLSYRDLSVPLPYYAYALARAGKTELYPTNYREKAPQYRSNAWYLAEAVLAASESKHDEAQRLLDRALALREYPYLRAVPFGYQYAEIIEWLWLLTDEPRYRERALEWARNYQTMAPTLAWPYAMEATLTSDRKARHRALEYALYLDPGSRRLQSIPKAARDAAKQSVGDKNPLERGSQLDPKGKSS